MAVRTCKSRWAVTASANAFAVCLMLWMTFAVMNLATADTAEHEGMCTLISK